MPPDYDTPFNTHGDIMIIPNFLANTHCKFLVEYSNNADTDLLGVHDHGKSNIHGSDQFATKTAIRNTKMVKYDDTIKNGMIEVIRHAVETAINPFFNVSIQRAEAPQILKYDVGGHYDEHVDSEELWHNKHENKIEWKKLFDRDISIFLYLNDDYEGGELVFPNQHITVNPKSGMLVAFPSNHHFVHSVKPVTKGTRYVVATWASLATPEDKI